MLDGFSDKAARAVRMAEGLATKLEDQSVATGHLIYGLSVDESGPIHHILKDLNIDPDMFSGYVQSLPREPEVDGPGDSNHNRHVRTVLERARECADELGAKIVEPEHLCIALLSVKAGSAYETLKEFSVDPEYVQMLILEAMGFEASDAPDWF